VENNWGDIGWFGSLVSLQLKGEERRRIVLVCNMIRSVEICHVRAGVMC